MASFPETSSSETSVYENGLGIWLTPHVASSFLEALNAQNLQDMLCLFFMKAALLDIMNPETTLATVLVGHRTKTSRPYPVFRPSAGVTCGDPEVKGTPFPGQSC